MVRQRTTLEEGKIIEHRMKREIRPRSEVKGTRIKVHRNGSGRASDARTDAGAVLENFRDRVSKCGRTDIFVSKTGSVGLWAVEPLVTVERPGQEPVIYKQVNPERVKKIFREHVLAGKVQVQFALARGLANNEAPNPIRSDLEGRVPHVSQLPFFALQENRILRNRGFVDPDQIEEYLSREGYQAMAKALLDLTPDEIITEVKTSGRRDRDPSAGFPTGVKWQFCASSKSETKYVICDAHGGGPDTLINPNLIETDPHALLEGMIIAAKAIGAHQGYIYCSAGCPSAGKEIRLAIDQARDHGLLGKDILRSGFDFDVEVHEGMSSCFCGEETALIDAIEGGHGVPRPRPPFPVVSGLWKKPTLVHCVETFLNIPRIIARGGEEYAKTGTESSKGTKVFALTGRVENIGMVEVPMGFTLGELIFDIGGGIPGGKRFKAVQVGGPLGGFISREGLNVPIDYDAISRAKAILGCGDMVVFDEDSCIVEKTLSSFNLCKGESCGVCEACQAGMKKIPEILEGICRGEAKEEDIQDMEELARGMKESAHCSFGHIASTHVLTTLNYFREEFLAHVVERRCPAGVCSGLFQAPCVNKCPAGIDIPSSISLLGKGLIGEAYNVIERSNPFPGVCGRVCYHPCQDQCRRREIDEPVAISNLERFIADKSHGLVVKFLPVTRKERVAIVGAGPSGLTAALELRKRGYAVTVFDEHPEPGGMLRYGIAAYRLPGKELDREINKILDRGIDLRLNTRVGKDVPWEVLTGDFDIVCLAPGCQKSCSLSIPGEQAQGVLGGVEFLKSLHAGKEVKIGKRVAVIGGGHAAIEAARTSLRLGARKVAVYYHRERKEMTAHPWEIEAAVEEGVEIKDMATPTRIITHYGKVGRLELTEMRRGLFDEMGRRKTRPILGAEFIVAVDTVIIAIQQGVDTEYFSKENGIETEGTRIKVDKNFRTSHPRIWAVGDAVTGPASVIAAIKGGQDVAATIDRALGMARGEGESESPGTGIERVSFKAITDVGKQGQITMPVIEPQLRRRDFCQVRLGYRKQMALAEARRCLQCDHSHFRSPSKG